MSTTAMGHREPVKLPVSDAGGGVLPGIDLSASSALLDILRLDPPEAAGDSEVLP
jgi:hypothetical protein